MIHYFNPGHEAAIIDGSKYYTPNANIVKMQKDLAFLPAWYAAPDDYILIDNKLTNGFIQKFKKLNPVAQAISPEYISNEQEKLKNQIIDFWGLSPQAVHTFEQYNKMYDLEWEIPVWKEEYKLLSSRNTASECLNSLIENIPGIEKRILPTYFSSLDEIEDFIIKSQENKVVKSPYSSSGRGLIWLPPGKIAQSEKQILKGVLKRQSYVSIEPALNKQLDFSMHFKISSDERIEFIGYSVFVTNAKGVYEKSILANQNKLEKQITAYIPKELLSKIKENLKSFILNKYAPCYKDYIGIDMLVYESNNQYLLNPCVEINMRKSMGYLSIRLFENYLHPEFEGEFFVDYNKDPQTTYQKHLYRQLKHPFTTENGQIIQGYFNLNDTKICNNYSSYLLSR